MFSHSGFKCTVKAVAVAAIPGIWGLRQKLRVDGAPGLVLESNWGESRRTLDQRREPEIDRSLSSLWKPWAKTVEASAIKDMWETRMKGRERDGGGWEGSLTRVSVCVAGYRYLRWAYVSSLSERIDLARRAPYFASIYCFITNQSAVWLEESRWTCSRFSFQANVYVSRLIWICDL